MICVYPVAHPVLMTLSFPLRLFFTLLAFMMKKSSWCNSWFDLSRIVQVWWHSLADFTFWVCCFLELGHIFLLYRPQPDCGLCFLWYCLVISRVFQELRWIFKMWFSRKLSSYLAVRWRIRGWKRHSYLLSNLRQFIEILHCTEYGNISQLC